jgi:hypothetical protein
MTTKKKGGARKARSTRKSFEALQVDFAALCKRKAHDDQNYLDVLNRFKLELADRNAKIEQLRRFADIGRSIEKLIDAKIAQRKSS